MINFLINYEKSSGDAKNTIINNKVSSILSSFMDDMYTETDEDNNNTTCLISGETLIENETIKLICGHKFNYDAIFNEVKQQKKSTAYNSSTKYLLKVKCPYCRTVQNGLLPLFPGKPSVRYVNSPEKYVMKNKKCAYLFLSGKKKGKPCNKSCYSKYCNQHFKIIEKKKSKVESKSKGKSKTNSKISSITTNTVLENIVIPNNKIRCQHVFTRGARKNHQCKYIIHKNDGYKNTNNKYYCKTHKNLKINLS